MPFHFTLFDWEAVGSFVVSKLDIHWIGNIEALTKQRSVTLCQQK